MLEEGRAQPGSSLIIAPYDHCGFGPSRDPSGTA